jgi:hypothetical protein
MQRTSQLKRPGHFRIGSKNLRRLDFAAGTARKLSLFKRLP